MNIDRQFTGSGMDRRQVSPYGYPSNQNYPYNQGSGSYGQTGVAPYQHQNHPISSYGQSSYGSSSYGQPGYGQPGYGQPGYGQTGSHNYGPDGFHSGEAGYPVGGGGYGGVGMPPPGSPYGGESWKLTCTTLIPCMMHK